ncbi:hypothetical protein pdam_00019691, partial [Pocillopora damicornis]
ILAKSIFDGVKLGIEKEKLKWIFGAIALSGGKRPTHAIGVAAQGIATVVSEPKFPSCEFLTPGKSFRVCLRHASLKGKDDAMSDFRGASIRFADSDQEDSPLDIIMSTGRPAVLSNVQTIYDALESYRSGNVKEFYLNNPVRFASNIDGLRRAPNSYYDQRYYSETIMGLKAFDSVERYVRFRLVPADGSLETGLLSKDEQRKAWEQERLQTETRPKEYLTEEFKARISRGPVKYKLQLTLHEVRSDDPPNILDIGRYWDENAHSWLDVADVTLTTILSPQASEALRFNVGNLPSSIYLLQARGTQHSNCIAHIRKEVYQRTQTIRLSRKANIKPDHVATYRIRVETGERLRAGTDANISVSLTGTRGKTEKLFLSSWSNDLEAGHKDEYTLQAMDVGEILMIHLHNDGAYSWHKHPHWFVNRITVTSSEQKDPFEFPCFRWVVSDMTLFIGKAVLPFQDQPEAGHVFIVDYKELRGIKRGGKDSNYKSHYAAEPICLFYVKNSGDLVPIAIQLFQEPSENNPIWTPGDTHYDWLLAKMWFRNADHQVHQMGTHLTKTHLLMEAFAVASWRQLPSIHPIFQLLFPHLRSVMAINTIGRNELIAKGGICDKTLSIGGGGHIQLLEKTYKNFKFEMLSLPGMDDGLLMWNAISDFLQEFVAIFYASDEDVIKDHELQSFVKDIHENGFPKRDQLVHLLTCIVFGCSCQHAAVNYAQMEFTGFVPNVPPVMRLPPPTRKNEVTLKTIMDTLPSHYQTGWHVATVYTLTRMAENERFIGDYSQSSLTGKEVENAVSRFQSSLQRISDAIKERNRSLEFPYPWLLPERVPNSVAI